MPQSIMVPTTITREASEFIREQGLQEPFEQMLDKARQLIPGLQAFEIELQPLYDEPPLATIIISALSADISVNDHSPSRAWDRWKSEAFSPAVWLQITLFIHYVPSHAR